MKVMSGLDVAAGDPTIIGNQRWGLLANHSAVTSCLTPARIALAASQPTLLFAPEHGLEGVAQDMEGVADAYDNLTGVPIRSLYGNDASTLRPRDEDLNDIELMIVDVPDIGTRYYTFAATMDAVMNACEARSIPLLVLDRPNPIGGHKREGGRVHDGFSSFVSQLPTPIRHGLTLGEIAMLLQRERYADLELSILLCRDWKRKNWWDKTGLPWVAPSPNMPTIETAAIYPGMCLFEATTLSEGRGTTRPFHLIGAPWIDANRLVDALKTRTTPGCAFRPTAFRPMFHKHSHEVCNGVELHITDRQALDALRVGACLLHTIFELYPEEFGWRQKAYEFVSGIPAIDLLTGSPGLRSCVESNGNLDELFALWDSEVVDFEDQLDGILLYHDRD